MENWENYHVLGINKEEGRELALPFGSLEDAQQRRNPHEIDLCGEWDFFWKVGFESEFNCLLVEL